MENSSDDVKIDDVMKRTIFIKVGVFLPYTAAHGCPTTCILVVHHAFSNIKNDDVSVFQNEVYSDILKVRSLLLQTHTCKLLHFLIKTYTCFELENSFYKMFLDEHLCDFNY